MLLILLACRSLPLSVQVDGGVNPSLESIPDYTGGSRAVGRLEQAGGVGFDFAVGDVVALVPDRATGEELARSLDAQVVNTVDPGTYGLTGEVLVTLRPGALSADSAQIVEDLRSLAPDGSGEFLLSSSDALATLGLAARLTRQGVPTGLDVLSETRTFLDSSSIEGVPAARTAEAFDWPHIGNDTIQDYGVSRAWQALELSGRIESRVAVGLINHEIERGLDFEPRTTWHLETDITEAAARNHGSQVASMMVSPADDAFGAVGVAGPIADLHAYEGALGHLDAPGLALGAAADGVRVLNMSFGLLMPEAFRWVMDPAGVMFVAARSSGTMLVAAAGNDGVNTSLHDGPFGTETTFNYPCEVGGVFCIGGQALNSRERDDFSNFGDTVEIYGPFVVDVTNPDGTNSVMGTRGTSLSSPFVAGAAGLVLAADPTLSVDEVEALLLDTAQASGFGFWQVDVDAAVRAAIGNVPPLVTIRQGGDITLDACDESYLDAVVDDDEAPASYQWSSDIEGVFSTTASARTFDLSPGVHIVTLTVTDPGGLSSTAVMTVDIENAVPVVALSVSSRFVCQGESVTLRAAASDCDWDALSVAWFDGTSSIGTGRRLDTSFSAGRHDISAVVTDGRGGSTTENAVVVASACRNQVPEVTVDSPSVDSTGDDGYLYTGYDEATGRWYADIDVSAHANDPEDGAVPSEDITWRTDRTDLQPAHLLNGGSGTIRLYGEDFWGDLHTITVTATDSSGAGGEALRTIYVWTLG